MTNSSVYSTCCQKWVANNYQKWQIPMFIQLQKWAANNYQPPKIVNSNNVYSTYYQKWENSGVYSTYCHKRAVNNWPKMANSSVCSTNCQKWLVKTGGFVLAKFGNYRKQYRIRPLLVKSRRIKNNVAKSGNHTYLHLYRQRRSLVVHSPVSSTFCINC